MYPYESGGRTNAMPPPRLNSVTLPNSFSIHCGPASPGPRGGGGAGACGADLEREEVGSSPKLTFRFDGSAKSHRTVWRCSFFLSPCFIVLWLLTHVLLRWSLVGQTRRNKTACDGILFFSWFAACVCASQTMSRAHAGGSAETEALLLLQQAPVEVSPNEKQSPWGPRLLLLVFFTVVGGFVASTMRVRTNRSAEPADVKAGSGQIDDVTTLTGKPLMISFTSDYPKPQSLKDNFYPWVRVGHAPSCLL